MNITVLLFARARDLAGSDHIDIEVAERTTIADLRRDLALAHPQLAGLLQRSAFAINDEFADATSIIPADARVALLPPVSGGQVLK